MINFSEVYAGNVDRLSLDNIVTLLREAGNQVSATSRESRLWLLADRAVAIAQQHDNALQQNNVQILQLQSKLEAAKTAGGTEIVVKVRVDTSELDAFVKRMTDDEDRY